VVLEIQEKVRVRVPRAYIDGKWTGATAGAAAKDAAKDGSGKDGEPKAA